jgi:signal transduction histidine kinase
MQRKQHKYQIELTDVSSLITPAIEVHRDEMPERGIEFNMEMPSGGLTVACDVNSMRAVFRNLISNAVRFTPDAGRISIDVYEREGWVVIRIFNSGATIPDETIKQIRTGMKVVPMTSATGESGSGMGLLLACEHMKGNRAVFEIQNVTDGVECIVRLRCPPA